MMRLFAARSRQRHWFWMSLYTWYVTAFPFMCDDGYKTFLASYNHDGTRWSIELPARDYDDAKARLARLPFASVDGELIMTLPASTGPLVTIITAFRNAVSRLAANN